VRPLSYWLMTLGLVSVLACYQAPIEPQLPPASIPLTVDSWKELPIVEKYDGATLDRLRSENKQLASQRAWDKFMREVVVPSRKVDIPED